MSSHVLALLQDADRADRIDDLTRDILDNPPYVEDPGLFDRLIQWMVDRFTWVGADAIGVLGPIIEGIIWVVLGAALLGVAYLVARRVGMGAFRRGDEGPGTTTRIGAADRSAEDWLTEAHRAREDGRHRDAVRAAYRAVVAHLVMLEAVPAMAGATVGAHRAALRRGAVVAELQARGFDRASEVFERVWYAEDDAGPDEVAVVLAAADALGVHAGGRP